MKCPALKATIKENSRNYLRTQPPVNRPYTHSP